MLGEPGQRNTLSGFFVTTNPGGINQKTCKKDWGAQTHTQNHTKVLFKMTKIKIEILEKLSIVNKENWC